MAPSGKGVLRIAIEDFLETFGLGDLLFKWYSEVMERLEETAMGVYSKTADTIFKGADLPPGYSPAEIGAIVRSSQNGFVVWIFAIAGLIVGGFLGMGQPSGRLAGYAMDTQLRSHRPPPLELAAMQLRGLLTAPATAAYLHDLGVPDDLAGAYGDLSQNLLTAYEYQVLWRRKEISDADLTERLTRLGMTAATIEQIKALGEVIPGPQDLVSMAVREAFDDRIAGQFGYDQNFPAEFGEWGEKQGLSRDWTKRYWRAHWNLPSPNQVFEMLHRLRPGKAGDPVTTAVVADYLRIADYAPYWRDRLQAISYSPLTRVDVRRMYRIGVLTEAQVMDAYLDLGYDDDNARALTQFTVAYEAEEETGVVRSSVTGAYADGFIDRGTAQEMLKAGGYDETTAAFYLDAIDFRHDLEVQQVKLTNIRKRYIEGIIDETSVNNEINQLNLPAAKTSALLELWSTERENKTALPTVSQVEKFYELGIASRGDFERIMMLRGYTTETIGWTLKRIDLEAQEKAQKDAETAAKEAERAEKSETSTIYQKNRADLDLEIAKARAQLTDIAVALHADLDPQQVEELHDLQDYLKQYIAAVTVAKAELKQALTGAMIRQEG